MKDTNSAGRGVLNPDGRAEIKFEKWDLEFVTCEFASEIRYKHKGLRNLI